MVGDLVMVPRKNVFSQVHESSQCGNYHALQKIIELQQYSLLNLTKQHCTISSSR